MLHTNKQRRVWPREKGGEKNIYLQYRDRKTEALALCKAGLARQPGGLNGNCEQPWPFFFSFCLPPSLRKTVSCYLLGCIFLGGGRLTRERKNTHTHNRLGWACINRFSFFFFFPPFVPLLALGAGDGLV